MVIPGGTYGLLLLLGMKYVLMKTDVHVPRLTPPTLGLYLHFWGMTTFVTLPVVIPVNIYSILMTLSGMVGGVVPPVPAAVSTPHPGSVKNYPSPPLMTLKSGCALIRLLMMKISQLKQLNSMFSEKAFQLLTMICIIIQYTLGNDLYIEQW